MNNYDKLKNFYCLLPKDLKINTYTKIKGKSKSHVKRIISRQFNIRHRNLKLIKILSEQDIKNDNLKIVFLQNDRFKIVGV